MDYTDRQIVDLLRQDGRRSNVEIARALGISEGTVRKRVDRLILGGALRIVGLTNPATVGYKTHVFILMKVELPHIENVGRELCAAVEVLSVCCLTGAYDIIAEAAFESDKHLMSFLTQRLAKLPGVVSSQVNHVPQVLKWSYEWALPQPQVPLVLIVDDDPDFAEVTRTVLANEGYRTRTVTSGDAALQAMASEQPDMVILDIMMEGVMDGWDASWRIRSDPRLRDTPILVVSSITASQYLDMFPTDEDNLVDNFLSKPVDPQRLLAEVKRLARRR